MNYQTLENYNKKFQQDLIMFYDNIKQFFPIIKIHIDSFIANQNFQDYFCYFETQKFFLQGF